MVFPVTRRLKGNIYLGRPALFSDKTSRYEQLHCDDRKVELYSLDDLAPTFSSQLTEQESIKKCIEECEARIEIGKYGQILPVKNTFSSNETMWYVL